MKKHSKKIILLIIWLGIISIGIYYYFKLGFTPREYRQLIIHFIKTSGYLAPLCYILLFCLRVIILFPAILLIALSGMLFGKIGIIYTIIGINLSAIIGFLMARYLGRSFIKENEYGKLKKMDNYLKENGFVATLIMRLLYFHFDLLNFGCGLSGMKLKHFAIATFIGVLPEVISITLLGNSASNPINLIFTALMLITGLIISVFLKKRHRNLANYKKEIND